MSNVTLKELSVESIRSRMIKNAARIWGTESEDIESTFDPIVSMLIEACSFELSKINNEILDTQSRVLQRLAQVLSPESYTGPKPSYSIMHARSIEAEGILQRDAQFYANKKVVGADQKEVNKEIYFSPAKPVKIFDASVKYMAVGKTLFEYKTAITKQVIADGRNNVGIEPSELWLGIELNSKINSLSDFVFCFDWKNNPDEEKQLQLLPLTKWYFEDMELNCVRGINQMTFAGKEKKSLTDLYDTSLRTETFVESFYENHFFTIQQQNESNLQSYLKAYPEKFSGIFSNESLAAIQGEYLWLKLKFSGALNPAALNDVYISLNVFPVINRCSCKITYQLRSNLNIVPLKTDDAFFNIIDVQNADGTYFKSNPITSGFKNDAGHYTLRNGGVERFDKRSATEYLNMILDLLRDESASFSALGNEFINNYINQINQSISMIENRLNIKGEKALPSHFIIITPYKPNENVFIRFWSTAGEEGNGVKAGSKINLSSGADVKSDSLLLLLTSSGGKEPLNENEKISAFRRSILTHDRIVTMEDVIAFCYHQLGNLVSNVEVSMAWEVSPFVKEGMMRIVKVLIEPKNLQPQLSGDEWQNIAVELKTKIDEASNKLIPIRVVIKNQ